MHVCMFGSILAHVRLTAGSFFCWSPPLASLEEGGLSSAVSSTQLTAERAKLGSLKQNVVTQQTSIRYATVFLTFNLFLEAFPSLPDSLGDLDRKLCLFAENLWREAVYSLCPLTG